MSDQLQLMPLEPMREPEPAAEQKRARGRKPEDLIGLNECISASRHRKDASHTIIID
jgi:hypothetical protein